MQNMVTPENDIAEELGGDMRAVGGHVWPSR
jgi:hypothetical protein